MAGLQERGGSYRVFFRFRGKQQTFPLGKVTKQEAEDTVERYRDAIIVAAIGIVIGIGVGVLICDMLEKKQQPKTPVPA